MDRSARQRERLHHRRLDRATRLLHLSDHVQPDRPQVEQHSIAGQFSDDNTMVSILLNGSATGISFKATGSTDYYGWQNFTIGSNANFKAGANTLTFVVQNQPLPRQMNNAHNPCGLQVAMIGQANPLGTVVVNSATTTDSNTVTVTYTVTGNNGTIPLLLKVYRSNSDQVNPAGTPEQILIAQAR